MIDIFDGVYGPKLTSIWAGQKYALTVLDIFSSAKVLVPAEEDALTDPVKKRIEGGNFKMILF